MDNEQLGELVKKAKGADRSLREYAKDSGVDAAIISKIINGTYTPKKPDIYKKLTSPEANPRGGVTYEQLITASDHSSSYQAGIAAGLAASGLAAATSVLSFIGATPLALLGSAGSVISSALSADKPLIAEKASNSSQQEDMSRTEEIILQFNKKQRQFKDGALGIIVTSLAKKGISCKIKNDTKEGINGVKPDEWLLLTDSPISDWWLLFWATDKTLDEHFLVPTDTRARRIMSEYVAAPADQFRKVSIVVDDSALYDEFVKLKDNNSYRGEMSVILVDTTNYAIIREEYIAHYCVEDVSKEIYAL